MPRSLRNSYEVAILQVPNYKMELMIVALNKSGEVCWLNKSGGLSMEAGEVIECVRIAQERVVEWTKYIEAEVLKDEQKRNKDKRYVESTAENERYEVPVQPI
jgi:hypothetical protein